jgi:hypothetical protein
MVNLITLLRPQVTPFLNKLERLSLASLLSVVLMFAGKASEVKHLSVTPH